MQMGELGSKTTKTENWRKRWTIHGRSERTRFLGWRCRWWRRPFRRRTWVCWGRPSCEQRWRERRRKRANTARGKLRAQTRSEPSRLDPPLALWRERERERDGERRIRGSLFLMWFVIWGNSKTRVARDRQEANKYSGDFMSYLKKKNIYLSHILLSVFFF